MPQRRNTSNAPLQRPWKKATHSILLEETRVGLAPGVAFGAGGEGSVRICYAAERQVLEQAMERIGRFLRESWRRKDLGGHL